MSEPSSISQNKAAQDIEHLTKYAFDEDDEEDELLSIQEWMRTEGKMFVRRFLRGLGTGAAAYGGVRIFSALMRNPFRKGIPSVWRQIVSVDCLRFAAFLGLFPSVYHLAVSTLTRYRKHKDGWNYGLAGAIAGLSLALDAPSRRKNVTFFFMARALGAGATTLVARELVTSVPHAEVWTFCTCCSPLLLCVTSFPKLLPKGYYHSVLKWSHAYTDPMLERLYRIPGERFLTCEEVGLHEGTCTKNALKDLLRSFPAFAKLYLPIHLAPILLFKRRMVKERPGHVLKSLAKNLTYSTLFLSTMVAIAKYVLCLLRHVPGRPPPAPLHVPLVAGFLCGFGALWERTSRRKELIMFLIPQLLNALHVLVSSSRLGSKLRVPQGHVLLFALAMGVVMHAYEREPPSLTMLLTGLLRFFVGERREKEGRAGGQR